MESYTAYSFVIASSVQQYVCEAHLFSLLYEVKWSEMKVTQSCLTLCDPMDHTVHGILQVRILEWVTFPFSRTSSQPRDRTQVSHVAEGFFTSWATRKAKNTVLSSLSLLQRIFLTQESNQGLLHCRQIPTELSGGYANWTSKKSVFLYFSYRDIHQIEIEEKNTE